MVEKLVTTMSGRPYYRVRDEDNMVSDDAHGIATQQSTKAYADALVTAGATSTQTLTNKTLTAPVLTSPVIDTGVSGTAVLDDDTMATATATTLASAESVKAYSDSGSQTMTNKTLTSPVLNTGVSGTAIADEDNMASDSATKLATQQSIKAYSDSGAQTMTNKTLTSPAINTGVSGTAFLDDDTMATATATTFSSAESIKAYVDNEVAPKIEYVTGEIADVSTLASSWTVAPIAGTITKIWLVLEGAVTDANAEISFEIATVAVTGGGITIVHGDSAVGKMYSADPTAANTVTAGQAIEILTNGASSTAAKATVMFEITPSATTTTAWKKFVYGEVPNISAAGPTSTWTIAPVAGSITKIHSVIDGAITVADAGITFELGGVAVTDGAITIDHATSAAGVVDSATPTAANVVTAGQAIEIIADGLSTDAAKAVIIFEITPSA